MRPVDLLIVVLIFAFFLIFIVLLKPQPTPSETEEQPNAEKLIMRMNALQDNIEVLRDILEDETGKRIDFFVSDPMYGLREGRHE